MGSNPAAPTSLFTVRCGRFRALCRCVPQRKADFTLMPRFQRDAAPDHAEDQKQVPPAVGVNDVADQGVPEKDDQRAHEDGLPWPVAEDDPEARAQRPDDQRDVAGKAEPGIVEQRLEPDIVGVGAEPLPELERADAERVFGGLHVADQMVGEPSGLAAVIVLQPCPLDQHLAHGLDLDGDQKRDHHRDEGRGGQCRDAQAEPVRGRCNQKERGQKQGAQDEQAPTGARERQEDRKRQDDQHGQPPQRAFERPGEHAVQAVDRGQGEERRKHVRILKGAHGPAVAGEQVGARHQIEIADNAQKPGQDGGREIAVHDDLGAPAVRGDHGGKEDRREGEKKTDGDIHRRVAPFCHRHHRDDAADVEHDQQHQ